VTLARVGSCVSIGQAKASPDGTTISTVGSITLLEPAECYIESTDRASGIWVQANTTGLSIGDVVIASGTLATVTGERVIQSATLGSTGQRSTILPFTICNGGLGGFAKDGYFSLQDYVPYVLPDGSIAYRWQITGGAPTAGVLAKTWGTVNAVYYSPVTTAHWFYVDDGTGVVSDYGDQGVIVYSDAAVQEGDSVTVTGVSSLETTFECPTRLLRTIRPRSASDVVVVKRPPSSVPVYPFPDEFNSAVLDPRWITLSGASKLSLTTSPGWLTLYSVSPTDATGPGIYQVLSGDWDLEMKVSMQLNSSATAQQFTVMGLDVFPETFATQYCSMMSILYDGTTNKTIAKLAGVGTSVANSDVYWFRSRMRFWTLYASVSLDGLSYSPEKAVTCPSRIMRICAYTNGTQPYCPKIDYIRFTRL